MTSKTQLNKMKKSELVDALLDAKETIDELLAARHKATPPTIELPNGNYLGLIPSEDSFRS
jgi:hypothetical protein